MLPAPGALRWRQWSIPHTVSFRAPVLRCSYAGAPGTGRPAAAHTSDFTVYFTTFLRKDINLPRGFFHIFQNVCGKRDRKLCVDRSYFLSAYCVSELSSPRGRFSAVWRKGFCITQRRPLGELPSAAKLCVSKAPRTSSGNAGRCIVLLKPPSQLDLAEAGNLAKSSTRSVRLGATGAALGVAGA